MASWRAWCEIWNETHPAKRFEKWRNFREYHLRGSREAIPTYKLPEPKPSAEKQQEIHAAQEHIIRALEGYMGKHGDRFIEATFE